MRKRGYTLSRKVRSLNRCRVEEVGSSAAVSWLHFFFHLLGLGGLVGEVLCSGLYLQPTLGRQFWTQMVKLLLITGGPGVAIRGDEESAWKTTKEIGLCSD